MFLRHLFLCLIFSLSLAVFTVVSSSPSFASINSDLIKLINNYRVSKGIGKLTADQKLTNASCWMAKDMAAKGYFSHIDSLGRNPFTRMASFGVSGGSRGENIASLTNQSNSAQKIFNGWKASSGHNKIMLTGSYKRIGIANAYRSKNKTYYWVGDFASGTVSKLTNECGVSVTKTSTPIKVLPATTQEVEKPKVQVKEPSPKPVKISARQEKILPSSELVSTTQWKTYNPDSGKVLGVQTQEATQIGLGLAVFLLIASLNIVGAVAWLVVSKEKL